jgi:ABC-type transport system involved in cytochrome bd biosynthesis fused ATPase/permease subunit
MGMIIQAVMAAAAAAVMVAAAGDVAGQQQSRERAQVQQRTQEKAGRREIIPGSELMTSGEREAYRQRYAAAKTEAEKEQVRAEHVKAMEERARLRGLQLVHPVAPKGGAK